MNICLNIHFTGLLLVLYYCRDVQGRNNWNNFITGLDISIIIYSYVLHAITISGAVTISPPGIASVCSGHQLELMCSVTVMFLQLSGMEFLSD